MKKIISILLVISLAMTNVQMVFGHQTIGNEKEVEEGQIITEDDKVLSYEEFVDYLYQHAEEIREVSNLGGCGLRSKQFVYSSYISSGQVRNSGAVVELIEGTWYIPGIGEVVIVGATIYIGGLVIVKSGSWIYKQIVKFFEKQEQKKIDKIFKSIPTKLRGSNGYVDLGKFTEKVTGKSSYKDPKTGWVIDKANHGGREWKLKDKK